TQLATDHARLLGPIGTIDDPDERRDLVADLADDLLAPIGSLVVVANVPSGRRTATRVGRLALDGDRTGRHALDAGHVASAAPPRTGGGRARPGARVAPAAAALADRCVLPPSPGRPVAGEGGRGGRPRPADPRALPRAAHGRSPGPERRGQPARARRPLDRAGWPRRPRGAWRHRRRAAVPKRRALARRERGTRGAARVAGGGR